MFQMQHFIFYAILRITESSLDLCKDLLDKVGLAIAPGIDFGENYKKYVRISYAGSMEELQKGLMLLKEYILKYK